MNPFGGPATRGFDPTPERLAGMKRFFRGGTLDQKVVATWASGDLVVLVTIEHVRAVIDGLPEQDWGLRVTQVYRREKTGWQLVHRHADPLAKGITVEEAAAITRPEKVSPSRADSSQRPTDRGTPLAAPSSGPVRALRRRRGREECGARFPAP